MKDTLGTQKTNIVFEYDEVLRKFRVYLKEGYHVRFKKNLAISLGLGDRETTLRNNGTEEEYGVDRSGNRIVYNHEKIEGAFMVDLNRGLHTFFIYSDIVEAQLVGDANVPLLRTLAVKGENGDVVSNSFDNIHYVPLSRSTFQTIEIYILDDTGQRVPFENGRVVTKLHFKRK